LDETNGDSVQLINEAATLGITSHYRRQIGWLSQKDSIEAGISLRNDWISQSQFDVSASGDRVLSSVVDASIRAMDAAGWLDLALHPFSRLTIRGGLRVDGLAYSVEDKTPSAESHSGAANDSSTASVGAQVRTALGTHYGPRVSLQGAISRNLLGTLSYGEGFRSPQARSLGDGERAPFTTVRSMEAGVRYVSSTIRGSIALCGSRLSDDLVFDAATTRNETVPGSERIGAALEFTIKPASWFVSSGSATYTRATFTGSSAEYERGDRLPYVPEVVMRQDIAVTPTLGQLWSRRLSARLGGALTGMFNRPQPYGLFGHNIALVDALAELRLKEVALGLDIFNLFDAHWYDSEFTYSANWSRGNSARLVPERYVTLGAPRTLLASLSLFID
jgi:hypothetical protein